MTENDYCSLYDIASKRVTDLEKELEQEKNLNAEIKARFVKCNTCTPDMKNKCPMFYENLCEGERCEELVDLMALVEKNDLQTKYEQLGERCNQLLKDKGDLIDENTRLKERLAEVNLNGNIVLRELTKAKEILIALLNSFVYDLAENEIDVGKNDVKTKAEQFLKEIEK